jgi:hypothetical protein
MREHGNRDRWRAEPGHAEHRVAGEDDQCRQEQRSRPTVSGNDGDGDPYTPIVILTRVPVKDADARDGSPNSASAILIRIRRAEQNEDEHSGLFPKCQSTMVGRRGLDPWTRSLRAEDRC